MLNRNAQSSEEKNEKRDLAEPVLMIVFSICSAVGTFGLSIFLARVLGPAGFKDYIFAVAAVSLLGTFAEFGTGKYALKVVPDLTTTKRWELAAGFWRFSFTLVLSISLVIALTIIAFEFGHDAEYGDYLLGIAVLFLPSTALVCVVSEFVMANRSAIAGTVIMRLILPLGTFLLVAIVYLINGSVSSLHAILCFGFSGIIGLALALWMFGRTAPPEIFTSKSDRLTEEWLRHFFWYFALAFLASWILEISVIVMEVAGVPELEIARYGAALKTGCFILLVAKSTNKFYSPELALGMSDQNWNFILIAGRQRLLVVGLPCIVFFLGMLFFGRPILSWYGPEYPDAHLALCFISAGACIATLFSMAPEYLKFSNRLKTVMLTNLLGGVLLVILTWILSTRLGANGAGIAFAIVITVVTLSHRIRGMRHLRSMITD